MTIDEARAVLPALRKYKPGGWCASVPDEDADWLVMLNENSLYGCQFEIHGNGLTVETQNSEVTPDQFRAALQLAGVIQ